MRENCLTGLGGRGRGNSCLLPTSTVEVVALRPVAPRSAAQKRGQSGGFRVFVPPALRGRNSRSARTATFPAYASALVRPPLRFTFYALRIPPTSGSAKRPPCGDAVTVRYPTTLRRRETDLHRSVFAPSQAHWNGSRCDPSGRVKRRKGVAKAEVSASWFRPLCAGGVLAARALPPFRRRRQLCSSP